MNNKAIKGTRANPWTNAEARSNALFGDNAVAEMKKRIGRNLTLAEERVVRLEGLVPGFYQDSKGILTYGVGQTGVWMSKGFVASFNHHADKTKDIFGDLGQYPEEIAAELIQLTYRGDAKKSYNWVEAFNNGLYDVASKELLNHTEYNDYKAKGVNNSITQRLEEASNAFANYKTYLMEDDLAALDTELV